MDDFTLSRLGWKPYFQQQIAAYDPAEITLARVAIHHGVRVGLLTSSGAFNVPVQNARAGGDIGVGDWLVLDNQDHRALQRLERKTVLQRHAPGGGSPQIIAANIDTLLITTSCNEDFNLPRLERYIALALQSSIRPVVVLTKIDRCTESAVFLRQSEALHQDLNVVAIDARQPEQAKVLMQWCEPGETVALLGSSGVGKSTLANALGATDQATGDIREQDGKGRHTTTARSLHLLPSGGVLIDNPGVRELQLPAADDAINDLFEDIFEIATHCRFGNCRHENDAGCAVRCALAAGDLDAARFARFKKLVAEQNQHSAASATRREGDQVTGKKRKFSATRKRPRRDEGDGDGDHN